MEDEIQGLRRQARAVVAAPLLFALAILVAGATVWGAVHVSYRAILASKDRHIALLERRIADYRDAVNGATPDKALRRIEAMEIEMKTLRLRAQPRRVTQQQRQAILDRSRLPAGASLRGVTVTVEDNCSDCPAFAADLVAALRDTQGWSVNTATMPSPSNRPRTGLAIRVADRLRPPPDAAVLQQALRSAGLEYTMLGGSTDPNIELLVTERLPQ
jgi:hypothetical protein